MKATLRIAFLLLTPAIVMGHISPNPPAIARLITRLVTALGNGPTPHHAAFLRFTGQVSPFPQHSFSAVPSR